MFNEDEDWSDEQEAQILSQNVLKNTQKTKSSTNVKVVGKKSLLRTLQTLGSVPEWESNNRLQDSDSETETAPSHSKKKRRKKRKHKEKHEDGQENGDINHAVPEEKPLPKKRKKAKETGSINSNKITAGEKKEKEISDSAQVNTNKPQDTERVSRKLWKNKMKNKRKCKNKYRQDKLEDNVNKTETADKQEQKKEVKIDSQSNKNISQNIRQTTVQKRKEKERKPLKKNNADRGTPTIEKQQHKEKKRLKRETEKSSSDSSGVGSKPIPHEHQGKITDDQQKSAVQKRKPELNKDQSLKRQKLRKIILSQETDQHASPADQKDGPVLPEEEVKQSGSDSFRARMEQRLESARFRYINEVLYSTTSGEAKRMFQQDPQAFRIYHKGYTAQVQRWPSNPVDEIIAYIQKKSSSLVVADFGCGDCKIARSVKNKVHSFDLVATSNLVTVCDMANVPLGDSSVDIAVFCLSLMGTNLADFLAEANRVLKIGGVLKIAEVASRFDNVRNFISALASLGFKLVSKGTENTHFHSFEFRKTGNAPKNVKKYGLQLKPCVYKKR